jgi:hypothetical protein
MADCVIDTNVLLVGSAADPYSPFNNTHIPAELSRQVLEWLMVLRGQSARRLVLDQDWKIMAEYRNKLTEQDYGMQVILERLSSAIFVPVQWDANGDAVVPPALGALDRSDRKFAAAALNHQPPATLINCADTDWLEVEPACVEVGLQVEHILEDWLRATRVGRS